MKKVDLSKLPPCRRSLVPDIKRVNYHVSQWKHADLATPDIPLPTRDHGWNNVNCILEPLWTDGSVLHSSLNEVAGMTTSNVDNTTDVNCDDDLISLDGSYYSSGSDSDMD